MAHVLNAVVGITSSLFPSRQARTSTLTAANSAKNSRRDELGVIVQAIIGGPAVCPDCNETSRFTYRCAHFSGSGRLTQPKQEQSFNGTFVGKAI